MNRTDPVSSVRHRSSRQGKPAQQETACWAWRCPCRCRAVATRPLFESGGDLQVPGDRDADRARRSAPEVADLQHERHRPRQTPASRSAARPACQSGRAGMVICRDGGSRQRGMRFAGQHLDHPCRCGRGCRPDWRPATAAARRKKLALAPNQEVVGLFQQQRGGQGAGGAEHLERQRAAEARNRRAAPHLARESPARSLAGPAAELGLSPYTNRNWST